MATLQGMLAFLLVCVLFVGRIFAQDVETLENELLARDASGFDNRSLNAAGELELRRYKMRPLQSAGLASGVQLDLGSRETSSLSSSFLQGSIGSGIPLGDFTNIVAVTPGFRVDWLDAAPEIDVSKELYEFNVQFFYRRPLRERLSAMFIISPSLRSDLSTSREAFRMFGLGLLNWETVPDRLMLSGGVVFLGRADLPALPAVGLRWTPSVRTQLDLQFPTSRLGQRLAKDGGRSEVWAYSSFGIGGNTWAVTRRSNEVDELSLRDWRLVVGVQRLLDGGGNQFLETGVAFGRRLEYDQEPLELEFGNAWLLQAGWTY